MFSGFLKSPQGLPAPRSVPNGGLGGLVKVQGRDNGSESRARAIVDVERNGRKKPAPILLNNVDVPAPAQTAPVTHVEDWLLNTQEPPQTAIAAFSVTDEITNEPQSLASRLFWQRSQKQKPTPRKLSSGSTLARVDNGAPQIQPIELPGSLLLPDQGYGSISCYSPPLVSRARTFSDASQLTFVPTSFSPISPQFSEAEGFTALFRPINRKTSEFTQQIHSANKDIVETSSLIETFTTGAKRTSEINTLSALELLLMLPTLKNKDIIDEWIPAMEKEFAKFKAVIQILHPDVAQEDRLIRVFSEDVKYLLRQAKEIATAHEDEFKKAQAEVDVNQQNDLEKLTDVETKLCDATSAYDRDTQDILDQAMAYARLQGSLYHANSVLGGFVRNNLAHVLHKTDEGLTKEVISKVSAFERSKGESYRRTLSTFIVPQDYEETRQALSEAQQRCRDAEELVCMQQKIEKDTSTQLDRALEQLERRTLEVQQIETELTNLKERLELERAQSEAYRKKIDEHDQEIVNENLSLSTEDQVQRTSAELEREIDAILNSYTDGSIDYEAAIFHQQQMIEELTNENTALRDSILISGASPLSLMENNECNDQQERYTLLGSRKLRRVMQPVTKGVNSFLNPLDPSLANQSSLNAKLSKKASVGQTLATIHDYTDSADDVVHDPPASCEGDRHNGP